MGWPEVNCNLLSQEKKIRLVTGEGMWKTWEIEGKVPSLSLSDGPHGIRKEQIDNKYNEAEEATCFPTASCIACSWDLDLVRQMAIGLAKEAINKEVDILLGPGVNMKRSPLCGRNFEYFSEDPYLTGLLAIAYVQGLEAMGVGSSLKHFACNNQETNRQTANAQVDERALREIYLRAFELVVKQSQPATIMNSYNRLNGKYTGESAWLLTDILRQEWGYQGLVVSDWSATIHLDKCIAAGMDLEMPDSIGIHQKDLEQSLASGDLAPESLDRAVSNILRLAHKYGSKRADRTTYDIGGHHDLARKIATESAVLLQNTGVLPLDINKDKELVVIGSLAKHMRFQGGGSSNINARVGIDAVTGLEQLGFSVEFAPGYSLDSVAVDQDLQQEALTLVDGQKTVVFFAGLTEIVEGEGFDRQDLKLPENQRVLLEQVLGLAEKVIYVSFSGSAYEIPFVDQLSAVLQMYLAGEACGEAVCDLLTGQVNPSGRLAETWPCRLEDVASSQYFDRESKDLEYRESLYIGYRYFNSYRIPVLFPFGHGLSYTSFSYGDLQIAPDAQTASVVVQNTGACPGKEVIQVYVENPERGRLQARRELRGFAKIFLQPGEEAKVEIRLDDHAFKLYEPGRGFVQVKGLYKIQVGRSVEDIVLEQALEVGGDTLRGDDASRYPDFYRPGPLRVSQACFEKLYSKPLSQFDQEKKGDYSLTSSLDDLARTSRFARWVRSFVLKTVYKMFDNRDKDDPQVQMMIQGATTGPIDAVACQSGSLAVYRLVCLTVNLANGRLSFAKPKRNKREQ